jgi:hypothetical protein
MSIQLTEVDRDVFYGTSRIASFQMTAHVGDRLHVDVSSGPSPYGGKDWLQVRSSVDQL